MKTPDPEEALRLLASRKREEDNEEEDESILEERGRMATLVVHWDEELWEELWYRVLSFVEPLHLLTSVSVASKFLHDNILNTNQFWLHYLDSIRSSPKSNDTGKDWLQMGITTAPSSTTAASDPPTPAVKTTTTEENSSEMSEDDSEFLRTGLNRHQLQRLCLYCVDAPTPNQAWSSARLPSGLFYGSRLVTRTRAENIRNRNFTTITTSPANSPNSTTTTTVHLHMERRRVCLASSTEHASELLENVLESDTGEDIFRNLGILAAAQHQQHLNAHQFQQLLRPQYWWSSQPSTTPASEETILFTTNCPLAVLSSLRWRPLLDPFTRGQVYSWTSAVVKAYRLPLHKLDSKPEAPNAGFPCSIAIVKETTTTTTTTRATPTAAGATSNASTTQQQQQRRQRQQQPQPMDVDGDANEDSDVPDDSSSDEEGEDDLVDTTRREGDAITRVLKDETPVYVSPQLQYNLYPPPSSGRRFTHQQQVPWQKLIFPSTPIIANVITITLQEKSSRQFDHSGFYACVEQVQLDGIPLLMDPHNQKMYHHNCVGNRLES